MAVGLNRAPFAGLFTTLTPSADVFGVLPLSFPLFPLTCSRPACPSSYFSLPALWSTSLVLARSACVLKMKCVFILLSDKQLSWSCFCCLSCSRPRPWQCQIDIGILEMSLSLSTLSALFKLSLSVSRIVESPQPFYASYPLVFGAFLWKEKERIRKRKML